MAGVIEHLYNPEICLYEINRVLKSNGILILSTQNSASLKERVLHLAGKTSSETQTKSIVNRHLFFFSHSMLKKMIEEVGFFIQKDFGLFQIPKTKMIFNASILKSLVADTFFIRCIKQKEITYNLSQVRKLLPSRNTTGLEL
jgi:2-polyprenyl-3-methyl-5-hydroxy-6-metoxy-1,4-benzoquinol methylase